jgi:hypothetical protein
VALPKIGMLDNPLRGSGIPIGYKMKFELPNERRPPYLKCGQFGRSHFGGAAVRAGSHNAAKHGRDSDRHDRGIEPEYADQQEDENHTAARDRDSPRENKLAAALHRCLERIDLGFQPHDLATLIVRIHGGDAGDDKRAELRTASLFAGQVTKALRI